ncbi:MAG: energy-coupling factor ABC transporter permease [Anaerolineae bacterium]|nr:energy-coupling factor ABC transporter permease [Anaerolineae bacterium]
MPIPPLALHIPDGFLSVPVAVAGWALTVMMIGLALHRTRDRLGERQIPLMGILAAFVFAAQMINFPVAGGTSGHLLGGALVAILIGPWAASLVMTAVVGVQALLFQDGGLLALGFNIFNMGILSAFTGYALYALARRLGRGSRLAGYAGAAAGAWAGVMAAAAATSFQLAASSTAPLGVALPAMLGVHALIGIGEALITVGALVFIGQTRPDLLHERHADTSRGSGWVAVGLLIALAVAFASPLASPHPDGLERVAEDQGFIEAAQGPAYEILPDYQAPFVQNEALATILSGVIGVGVVAGLGMIMARTAARRSGQRSADSRTASKP